MRPAEKRERLHEPHDGLLPEMRLNPEEQVRRRALPLKKGADGLLHKDISTKE